MSYELFSAGEVRCIILTVDYPALHYYNNAVSYYVVLRSIFFSAAGAGLIERFRPEE